MEYQHRLEETHIYSWLFFLGVMRRSGQRERERPPPPPVCPKAAGAGVLQGEGRALRAFLIHGCCVLFQYFRSGFYVLFFWGIAA